ncbi:hypothetical protein [uncultured Rubinisphaera sp.]|uniref:hypothetical protein n=1 Tax=uncultured Rubinisphaera sp. TaxID=1678686 RepID=UPI000EBBD91B|nr:hypothetical protein [Planctomycetaceae bacterium]
MSNPQQKRDTGPATLGIHMKCCNVYIYAHINAVKDAYVGWCPKCAKQVRINISKEGGSTSRFFEAN